MAPTSSSVVESADDLESYLSDETTDGDRPVLDEGGLLRYGDRWVAVPLAQIPVAELLVDRFGQFVDESDIVDAYATAGATTSPAALKAAMNRLARRLRPLGLALHRVRGRGHVLDTSEARAA